jgi:DNA-binding CsgD family transcriptional regulator
MRWNAEQLAAIVSAVESARAGRPRSVVVSGGPGFGKSSYLDEVVARASGFAVRRVDCLAVQARPRYGVLDQLGIDITPPSTQPTVAHTLVARRMRAMLDQCLTNGPVLVVLDDAQWADPESVEALAAVMGRVEAEQMLFVVASHPLEAGEQPGFQRWRDHDQHVQRVELDGLDLAAAGELLREVRLDMPQELIATLWRHTEGNPLYLRELAQQFDETQLAAPILPAPARFAQAVTSRLQALSPPALSLAWAVAVLGDMWSPLPELLALADLDADAADAFDELNTAGFAAVRNDGSGMKLRFAHTLLRSAVYQAIPLRTRIFLHLRAASTLHGQTALEHRMAAALQYDDALAHDLEQHAAGLRAHGDFRSAARYLRFASTLSAEFGLKEQRWLESLIDLLIGADDESVRAELEAVAQSDDARRRDLILAMLAYLDWSPKLAVRLLEPWSGAAYSDVSQHRIEGLLAWTRLISDAPEEQVRAALKRAGALSDVDTTIARLVTTARAQLTARSTSDISSMAALAQLPDDPRRAPLSATTAVGWRGAIAIGLGHFDRGILDLTEVTERMQAGSIGFSSGTQHAMLARAQWFAGDWARARLNFRSAAEHRDRTSHPMVLAALPMQAIGEGDLDRAHEQIMQTRELLSRVRWREAMDQHLIVEVAFAHAADVGQADLWAALKPALNDPIIQASTKSVMWATHVAVSAIWAQQINTARQLADHLSAKPRAAPWTRGLADWIRGLASEATGDDDMALQCLAAAAATDLSAVPPYQAHVLADHARLAQRAGDLTTARASMEDAAAIYRSLGARAYMDRLNILRRMPLKPMIELSERERDVLTLVVAGLSYAQIARDLFITQRTVGYHLGNIYAKSDVHSRHQLVELARSDATVFGLPRLTPAGDRS